MSAHQGIKKTQDKISAVFYWPSMLNDVKAHVINCDLCSDGLVKQGLTKAPLGHLPLVGEPFRSISVDIAGPIEPRSASGYRYILSIVDMATRFPEAIPLKTITAEEVAEELFKFYCRMGIPERIHTDRGSQFTSDLMSKVNRMLAIKHTFSSPYHAMGNGAVERLNGTIKMTLRKLIKEQPKEWDRFLVPLLFALRDGVHEGHGFTPFELVYGRSTRGPMKILRELWTKDEIEEETRNEYQYMLNLQEKISDTCRIAQEELAKNQRKSEKYYNRKARLRKFDIGGYVKVLLPLKTNKMQMKWRGPYEIVDKIGELDYRVKLNDGKVKTYHVNMLKRDVDRNIKEAAIEENHELAAVITVVNDGEIGVDEEMLDLFNSQRKETYKDVKVSPNLSAEKKKQINELLWEFKDIFSDVPGRTDLAEHEIKLTSDRPVRSKPYPTPYNLQKEIDKEIDSMLDSGIIERSEAAYTAHWLS